MERQLLIFLPFLISAIFVVGCDLMSTGGELQPCEQAPAELVEESLTYFDGGPYSEVAIVRNSEKLQNEIAGIFEGFGGLWLQSSETSQTISGAATDIVIGVTDIDDFTDREDELMDKIKQVLDEQNQSYTSISITQVEFTFAEIQYVRDLLTPVIHQRDDIVESFIDIERNCFFIGILEGSSKSDYLQLFDKYCISRAIITIFETDPVQISLKMAVYREVALSILYA